MLKLRSSTIESFIGRSFFYADKETGIGWTSKIDSMTNLADSDAYRIELSCGTLVTMERYELLKYKELPELTNIKG